MQEILVLIVIALAIFYLPRVIGRGPVPRPPARLQARLPVLTGRIRLAILITVSWIAGSAAIFEPWQMDTLPPFLSFGLGPPAALCGVVWVWYGYRKYRR